jgi:pimeloyl-ACP methyl ester carboxylesterase
MLRLAYLIAMSGGWTVTSMTSVSSRLGAGACGCVRDGAKYFAGDLPEQEQKLVWAVHNAPPADLFNRKMPGTAWRSKPTWYMVAKNDRTVHPELERFVAKRMGVTTHEVDSSRVPMLSNPKLVIDVIRAAAKALQGATVAAV